MPEGHRDIGAVPVTQVNGEGQVTPTTNGPPKTSGDRLNILLSGLDAVLGSVDETGDGAAPLTDAELRDQYGLDPAQPRLRLIVGRAAPYAGSVVRRVRGATWRNEVSDGEND